MSSAWRRRGLKVAQYAIATGALAWLVAQVDLGRTAVLFRGVGPQVPVAIIAITGLEFGSRFAMWHVLLNANRVTRFRTAARLDVLIKFINHLIPSKASGHSIAPIVLYHLTDHDWAESVALAGINTGLYASLYGVVAFGGVLAFWAELPPGLLVIVGLSTMLYLGIGGTVLGLGRHLERSERLFDGVQRVVSALPGIGSWLGRAVSKVQGLARPTGETFVDVSRRLNIVGPYAVAWAGTLMIFPGLRVGVLLWALDVPFEPLILLPFLLVMAYSVTILPVTPGGVGIAEASAVIVFVAVGVPESIAVTVVFLDRLLGVYLPALLGWYPATQVDIGDLVARSPSSGENSN